MLSVMPERIGEALYRARFEKVTGKHTQPLLVNDSLNAVAIPESSYNPASEAL